MKSPMQQNAADDLVVGRQPRVAGGAPVTSGALVHQFTRYVGNCSWRPPPATACRHQPQRSVRLNPVAGMDKPVATVLRRDAESSSSCDFEERAARTRSVASNVLFLKRPSARSWRTTRGPGSWEHPSRGTARPRSTWLACSAFSGSTRRPQNPAPDSDLPPEDSELARVSAPCTSREC
jgi:hypothetical protein